MKVGPSQLGFAFLLGGIVGAFAGIVAVAPPEETGASSSVAPLVPTTAPQVTVIRDVVALPPEADDDALAAHLSQARFDHDWGRVEGVAQALRERRHPPGPAEQPQFQGGPTQTSLVQMDHDYRREAFLLELQGHDNAATAIAKGDLPREEREARLRALFLAPPVEPEDAQVRRDAAFLLGLLETPAAREALLRALKEPDADLAELAAEALARSGDAVAASALIELLAGDLDPTQRARAARALAVAPGAAEDGPVAAALARAAREDRDRAVRTHAIASLAHVDLAASAVARQVLLALVEDPAEDVTVRRGAVAAIAAHRQVARSLPVELVLCLERALERTSGPLRLEVIQALGQAGRPESLALLEAALLGAKDGQEAAALRGAVQALKGRTDAR